MPSFGRLSLPRYLFLAARAPRTVVGAATVYRVVGLNATFDCPRTVVVAHNNRNHRPKTPGLLRPACCGRAVAQCRSASAHAGVGSLQFKVELVPGRIGLWTRNCNCYAMAAVEVVPIAAAAVGDEGKELNGIVFESFSHTGTILKGLNELRLKGVLVDVTLRTEGKVFRVSSELSTEIM